MMQPVDHHLAEFNFGTLRYGWDDPRVADFVNNLELVNGIAEKSPGFIWRLTDEAMETAQATADAVAIGDHRLASTLSVWMDLASLENFVWNTVHRQFYGRNAEWYDAVGNGNLVLWWVPVGHCPGFDEGMARWQHRVANGESDHAFGWSYLKEAQRWKTHQCNQLAAE
ncbi:MAG: hypothetical protein JWS10_432 [Cypionkella sp.]|uniref:DUF3291 domain-containing protein n=1 Tax=Cypionkella sp. TaxID=2811411 RepID=UPI00261CEB4F|nr:DUF3291 domain-containing protein [Cypionkella sp.]MDB5657817.1 hypothetical protein [Cypionkella sp.]